MAVRKDWIAQMERILAQLHSRGICWGVSSHHTIIDTDGRVHLDDFGNVYESVWLPMDMGTLSMEGYLIGLKLLKQALLPETLVRM